MAAKQPAADISKGNRERAVGKESRTLKLQAMRAGHCAARDGAWAPVDRLGDGA
jgi:hypothetical protein